VPPPCPDELAWISKLAGRFGIELPPHPAGVYSLLAEHLFRDLRLEELGERVPLPPRHPFEAPSPATTPAPVPLTTLEDEHFVGALRLQRYRAHFSGPAVERVPELAFHRPEPEVELSPADAERRGIATGDPVLVRSNGTSVELRARVSRALHEGVARVAEEHAGDLHPAVEVVKT
jgi:anaerobic selenocysteine-containing dehydrogenase